MGKGAIPGLGKYGISRPADQAAGRFLYAAQMFVYQVINAAARERVDKNSIVYWRRSRWGLGTFGPWAEEVWPG